MRAALLGMAALLAECPDRTIAIVPVEQSTVEDKDIPVTINRDLDILFVIDKSPTMKDEQASLTANFGRFMQILSGDQGCGFEQHLGSLEAALFDNPQNAGSLRPNALLAIIIISDEDDCTANDTQIYNSGNTSAGPRSDFRCFEYGWECDEGTMGRDAATYTNCSRNAISGSSIVKIF